MYATRHAFGFYPVWTAYFDCRCILTLGSYFIVLRCSYFDEPLSGGEDFGCDFNGGFGAGPRDDFVLAGVTLPADTPGVG